MPAPTPTTAPTGDELLAAVTEAMIAFHQRYYHREPVTAKTLLLGGERLVCVLGGVDTDVEKTMIEPQRSTMVQETRNAFRTRSPTMRDCFPKGHHGLRRRPRRGERHSGASFGIVAE
jgi:Na+-translocating membrane potential-generating system (MpsC)